MGVGYLEPEMSAVGVPMEGRGARADEYLQAMRALWEEDAPAFSGRYVEFEGVDAHPRPLQRPLPVVVGGHSAAAHRRAVAHGEGWYGYMLDREATARQIESLRNAADAAGRDLADYTITVSPAERLEPDSVRAFGELGVDRLVLVPRPDLSLADLEKYVRARAPSAWAPSRPAEAPTSGRPCAWARPSRGPRPRRTKSSPRGPARTACRCRCARR